MSVIYYQNSIDGRCAAAIASQALHTCYLLPTNFGYQPNFSKLKFGEKLYLLGVLWDNNAMNECIRNYKFTYIDHHESSKRDYKYAKMHKGGCIQDTSVSTAVSTWKYFFPDDPVPKAVQMISDYTLGDFSNPDVVSFMEGLNTVHTYPNDSIWTNLLSNKEGVDNDIKIIQERGKEIIDFNNKFNLYILRQGVYETTLLGYKCLAINFRSFSHDFFKEYMENMPDKGESVDLLLMYTFRGFDGKYKVTVFANKESINLTEILPRLHGGGQAQIGAFCCDELPFEEKQLKKPLDPFKFDVNAYLNSHLVARQYKRTGDRTLFNQCAYFESIDGFNCGVINTPEESKQPFDFVNPSLPSLDLGICWSWDNRGQYKISIFPISHMIDKDGMIRFISRTLGYEGGAKFHKDGVTFFVDILPFRKIKRDENILNLPF